MGAVLALTGVILNRLNVSVIAFRWDAPVHYVPGWMEWVVTAGILCAEIWAFRWVIHRMPVLGTAREPDTTRLGEEESWSPRLSAA